MKKAIYKEVKSQVLLKKQKPFTEVHSNCNSWKWMDIVLETVNLPLTESNIVFSIYQNPIWPVNKQKDSTAISYHIYF